MKATGYKHLNHKQRSIVELYLNKDAKLISIAKEINKDDVFVNLKVVH